MKKFQLKSLFLTSTILCAMVILKFYRAHQYSIKWNKEISQLVCSEVPVDWLKPAIVETKMEKNEDYIHPQKNKVKRKNKWKPSYQAKKTLHPVNINTANTEVWKSLPGIGDVLSERIVKFRNRLGGFYAILQIKEVYGLSEETYVRMKPFLVLTNKIKLMDLETIEFKTLLSHPYFSYEDVKAVKNFLRHNQIRTKEGLAKASAKDMAWVNKVWPYLKIDGPVDNSLVVNVSK